MDALLPKDLAEQLGGAVRDLRLPVKSAVDAMKATTLTTWTTLSRSPTTDFSAAIALSAHWLRTLGGLLGADVAADLAGHHQLAVAQRLSWQRFHVVDDQFAALEADVHAVRSHPLIPGTVMVGGFVYDVDSGLLEQQL